MPPWPALGAQTGMVCANAAAGASATKKSSAAALVIGRIEALLAGLVGLLAVQPCAQGCELDQVVLLLGGEVVELALQLRHLQLAQLLELLHFLNADHVADLQRLHVPHRPVREALALTEE